MGFFAFSAKAYHPCSEDVHPLAAELLQTAYCLFEGFLFAKVCFGVEFVGKADDLFLYALRIEVLVGQREVLFFYGSSREPCASMSFCDSSMQR